jgi:hypothetical protein
LLTFSVLSGPLHGVLTLVDPTTGSFNYIPDCGYTGGDVFTFSVTDDIAIDTGAFTINVTNHTPVASDGVGETLQDYPLSGGVTASDLDGDNLTYTTLSGPAHGTLSLNSDGNFNYTPAAGYVGGDYFTFTASDGISDDAGTYVINIQPNAEGCQPPLALDDEFEYPDDPFSYIDIDVVLNDTDCDALPLQLVSVMQPNDGGSTSIVGNKVRYTPPSPGGPGQGNRILTCCGEDT